MAKNFQLPLTHRPRRLRRQHSRRSLVAETVLRVEDLIAPLFVVDGKGAPEPIGSMPGSAASASPISSRNARNCTRWVSPPWRCSRSSTPG